MGMWMAIGSGKQKWGEGRGRGKGVSEEYMCVCVCVCCVCVVCCVCAGGRVKRWNKIVIMTPFQLTPKGHHTGIYWNLLLFQLRPM